MTESKEPETWLELFRPVNQIVAEALSVTEAELVRQHVEIWRYRPEP